MANDAPTSLCVDGRDESPSQGVCSETAWSECHYFLEGDKVRYQNCYDKHKEKLVGSTWPHHQRDGSAPGEHQSYPRTAIAQQSGLAFL